MYKINYDEQKSSYILFNRILIADTKQQWNAIYTGIANKRKCWWLINSL